MIQDWKVNLGQSRMHCASNFTHAQSRVKATSHERRKAILQLLTRSRTNHAEEAIQ